MNSLSKGIFILLILSFPLNADIRLEYTERYYMNSGDSETLIRSQPKETWIGKFRLLTRTSRSAFLYKWSEEDERIDEMTVIDLKNKQYFSSPVPFRLSELLPKELLPVQMNDYPRIQIKPIPGKSVISGWECRQYIIRFYFMMTRMKLTVWSSEGLSQYIEGEAKKRNLYFPGDQLFLKSLYPHFFGQEKVVKSAFSRKIKELKGMWVKYELSTDLVSRKIRIENELTNVQFLVPEKNLYSVPEDFKKTSYLKVTQIQN